MHDELLRLERLVRNAVNDAEDEAKKREAAEGYEDARYLWGVAHGIRSVIGLIDHVRDNQA